MFVPIELNQRQSGRVLRVAARAERTVCVRPKAWLPNQLLTGRLLPVEHEDMELEVEVASERMGPDLVNMYCEVDVRLDDGAYHFDTHVLAVRPHDRTCRLTCATPDHVLVYQRRRNGRVALADTSVVQLHRETDSGLLCAAGLLQDISHAGLACSVNSDDLTEIVAEEPWCVCFELPGDERTFKFDAVVRRVVPSTSANAITVGVEFRETAGNEAERMKLERLLHDLQEALV